MAFPAALTLLSGLLSLGTHMTISRQAVVRIRDRTVRTGGQLVGLFVMMSLAISAKGHDVDVLVIDRDGKQVADVAVYAVRLDGNTALLKRQSRAVMDQVDRQFVPHVLVVQAGTPVEFPNSDTVAHHVYSFSHPNKFVLPMYKGEKHSPVTFEHSVVVSIGCNIHDHMLGYILVVNSTEFRMTDGNGHATLSLDNPDDYVINIWSPRIRDKEENLSKKVPVSDASSASVTFSLKKKLNPPHARNSDSESWSDY